MVQVGNSKRKPSQHCARKQFNTPETIIIIVILITYIWPKLGVCSDCTSLLSTNGLDLLSNIRYADSRNPQMRVCSNNSHLNQDGGRDQNEIY